MHVTFVEAPAFNAARDEYFGSDDAFASFQDDLARTPDAGVVLARTHGARKIRWGRQGQGKQGGLRIIYGYWRKYAQVLLLAVYCKSGKETLVPAEERLIAQLMREYEAHLKEMR